MRQFDTGATRDTSQDKLDFEAFLSPQVLIRFAEYMHKHRQNSDGTLRPGDNWQKGMPLDVYMKSAWRHFMDIWCGHRGDATVDMEESLCALLFNIQGYLHETLKAKKPVATWRHMLTQREVELDPLPMRCAACGEIITSRFHTSRFHDCRVKPEILPHYGADPIKTPGKIDTQKRRG